MIDTNFMHSFSSFVTSSGEGGTFALMQGLFPKHNDDEDDRALTRDSTRAGTFQDGIKGRRFLTTARWPLVIWSLFGTALTLSDGIFTPGMPHHTPSSYILFSGLIRQSACFTLLHYYIQLCR